MMKLTEGLSDLSLDGFVSHGLREPLTGKLTNGPKPSGGIWCRAVGL